MTLAVRGHRRGPGWTRLAHGLYLPAAPVAPLDDRLRAWRTLLPDGAVFTSLTAAELRGWWLPAAVPRPVLASVREGGRHPHRAGLVLTRLREHPSAELVRGVPLATAAETLLAAARDLDVLDLVPMADSALRLGHCTVAELESLAGQRRRGAPMLRRILPLLDARSESAWESVLRVLHRVAGLDVEPQHRISDAAGRFVARADLWLVGTTRIHQYDGEVHRELRTHRADLARDRRLVEAGWQRCGFTAAEVLTGGGIIASADALLGRRWDARHLQTWRGLVGASLYGPGGRARVATRWRTEEHLPEDDRFRRRPGATSRQ